MAFQGYDWVFLGDTSVSAVIVNYNAEHGTSIHFRQCKYVNNIVELDHRSIKRLLRPMLGFHSFHTAHHTIVDFELMRMIKRGQMVGPECEILSAAEQFYTLTA